MALAGPGIILCEYEENGIRVQGNSLLTASISSVKEPGNLPAILKDRDLQSCEMIVRGNQKLMNLKDRIQSPGNIGGKPDPEFRVRPDSKPVCLSFSCSTAWKQMELDPVSVSALSSQ